MPDQPPPPPPATVPANRPDAATRLAIVLSLLVFVLGLSMRIAGPSDLDQNADQTTTMALTADMVLNGHWLVPLELTGEKSKKPPLVNWIGAPAVMLLGWHEWVFKLPSILASVITFAATVWIGRRLLGAVAPAHATALAFTAAAAWMASPTGIKHAYFMRPDMTMIALMTLGWGAGIVALDSLAAGRPAGRAKAAFWILVGLAVLAKGPMALFLPLMLPASSWFVFKRLAPAARMGWAWGVPLAAAIFGAWLVPTAILDPDHVFGTLAGQELAERFQSGSPTLLDRLLFAGQTVGFFFERFLPFAGPAAVALLVWRPREIRTLGLAHPYVWLILIIAGIAVLGLRGGSYTAPAFPAAAILAVALLYDAARTRTRLGRWAPAIIAAIALISAASVGTREVWFSRGARSGQGEAVKAFAAAASARVGDASVAFVGVGNSAVIVLMGRHQAGDLPPEALPGFEYAVAPADAALGTPLLAASAADPAWKGPALHRMADVLDALVAQRIADEAAKADPDAGPEADEKPPTE